MQQSGGSPVITWRLQREIHLRTQKESDHMRGTHKLLVGTEEGGTCQDMERKELTERRIKEEGKEGRRCFGRKGRGGEHNHKSGGSKQT